MTVTNLETTASIQTETPIATLPQRETSPKTSTVLIVVDDDGISNSLQSAIEQSGFQAVLSGDALPDGQTSKHVGVVITDLSFSGSGKEQGLEVLRSRFPNAQIIILAEAHQTPEAVQAVQQGALSYLTFPIVEDALIAYIRQAARISQLLAENQRMNGSNGDGKQLGSAAESGLLAGRTLMDIEKQAIIETLAACRGNKARTARTLGISEKSIYNKMRRHGLSGPAASSKSSTSTPSS